MATLDSVAKNAFAIKNNVLRTLLHDGTGLVLKLWGPDETSGGRKYIAQETSGWFHYQRKNAEKGPVEEKMKVVETSNFTATLIGKAAGADIVDNGGALIGRFTIGAKSPLNPISKEWILTVTPINGETSTISS